MPESFPTVGLIGKYGDPSVADTLCTLADYLRRSGRQVVLDEATAQLIPSHRLETLERHALAAACDLAIVVGGDGTLLNAARSLAEAGTAVLGINLGRLGFLADVSPDDMERALGAILAGGFVEENRTLLHSRVLRDGHSVSESDALNDVVVHKWDIARMIELETRIDGRFLNTQRADGLIVATPTGSTAYALSGGGPIIEPTLGAMVLVPICPHTLSNRPIVVNDQARIEIVVHNGGHAQAQVTCDGQVNFALMTGDCIQVHTKNRGLRLIHPAGHDYFEILRAKLHWAENP